MATTLWEGYWFPTYVWTGKYEIDYVCNEVLEDHLEVNRKWSSWKERETKSYY